MAIIFGGPHPAGALYELIVGVVGAIAVVSVACGGLFKALAVLTDPAASRTSRWAAAGSVTGAVCMILVVLFGFVLEGG